MSGKELVRLMRANKVTIRELSRRIGITQIRIRWRRANGIPEAGTRRDWVQAITGRDPGPNC